MPRFFGHKQGVDALVRAVDAFADRGVEYLTVFAFSSENWKRPSDEVSGLMGLVLVAVTKYLRKLAADGVRIRIVGDRDARVRQAAPRLGPRRADDARTTPHHAVGGLQLRRPLGRRAGLPRPSPTACARSRSTKLAVQAHGLSFAPDPDLFIRTGGEMRISNFLLWQRPIPSCSSPTACGPISAKPRSTPRCRLRQRDRRFGGLQARGGAARRLTAMLRQRVITALVLLAIMLPRCSAAALALRRADAGADRRRRLGVGAAEPGRQSAGRGHGRCWPWRAALAPCAGWTAQRAGGRSGG
jgi:undecaprenyl diphosphate synthase